MLKLLALLLLMCYVCDARTYTDKETDDLENLIAEYLEERNTCHPSKETPVSCLKWSKLNSKRIVSGVCFSRHHLPLLFL